MTGTFESPSDTKKLIAAIDACEAVEAPLNLVEVEEMDPRGFRWDPDRPHTLHLGLEAASIFSALWLLAGNAINVRSKSELN